MTRLVKRKGGVGRLSVFIEGHFDYAHFLPSSEKCFPLHGHTSVAQLMLEGDADDSGMLLDFSQAKALLNDALSKPDHKLVAGRGHVAKDGEMLVVEYGDFHFRLPARHVFLLDGEGTSENLVRALAESMIAELPNNISTLRLTITEGAGKGSSVELSRRRQRD